MILQLYHKLCHFLWPKKFVKTFQGSSTFIIPTFAVEFRGFLCPFGLVNPSFPAHDSVLDVERKTDTPNLLWVGSFGEQHYQNSLVTVMKVGADNLPSQNNQGHTRQRTRSHRRLSCRVRSVLVPGVFLLHGAFSASTQCMPFNSCCSLSEPINCWLSHMHQNLPIPQALQEISSAKHASRSNVSRPLASTNVSTVESRSKHCPSCG